MKKLNIAVDIVCIVLFSFILFSTLQRENERIQAGYSSISNMYFYVIGYTLIILMSIFRLYKHLKEKQHHTENE